MILKFFSDALSLLTRSNDRVYGEASIHTRELVCRNNEA